MASPFNRARDFAQSPKGKQASKPENRRKLKELDQRYKKTR